MRLADGFVSQQDPAREQLDLSSFPGTWKSSDPRSRGIPKLTIEMRAGKLVARASGAADGGTIAWGETGVPAVYSDGVASACAAGLSTRYEFGFMDVHVQAQLKLGVLVLGTFTTFRDESGRRNYFSREFLAQDVEEGTVPDVMTPAVADGALRRLQDLDFGTLAEHGAVDPTTILGRWRNAIPGARGITDLVLEPRRERIGLEVWGAGEHDGIPWGETRVATFVCMEEDDVPSACALASYDFGFLQVEFQIRQNKGVLAVTTFNRFLDQSGRYDYVTRELFYRVS